MAGAAGGRLGWKDDGEAVRSVVAATRAMDAMKAAGGKGGDNPESWRLTSLLLVSKNKIQFRRVKWLARVR